MYVNVSRLVDGTFCQAALETKINIKEQLPKYLDAELQLCILLCTIYKICLLKLSIKMKGSHTIYTNSAFVVTINKLPD